MALPYWLKTHYGLNRSADNATLISLELLFHHPSILTFRSDCLLNMDKNTCNSNSIYLPKKIIISNSIVPYHSAQKSPRKSNQLHTIMCVSPLWKSYIFNYLFIFLLQTLKPLAFRSLLRLMVSLIKEPAASMTTLYYSHLLPHSTIWERQVRWEMLDAENYQFHFIINLLTYFW